MGLCKAKGIQFNFENITFIPVIVHLYKEKKSFVKKSQGYSHYVSQILQLCTFPPIAGNSFITTKHNMPMVTEPLLCLEFKIHSCSFDHEIDVSIVVMCIVSKKLYRDSSFWTHFHGSYQHPVSSEEVPHTQTPQ